MAFDNAQDLDSVLHLFERAVEGNMAHTDAIESCINSRKYKVGFWGLPISLVSLLHLHVLHLLSQHQSSCASSDVSSHSSKPQMAIQHANAVARPPLYAFCSGTCLGLQMQGPGITIDLVNLACCVWHSNAHHAHPSISCTSIVA